MCGIIGSFLTKEKAVANDWVVNQYEEQFNRGSKGFGVIGIDAKKEVTVKRATEPAKFMFDLHQKPFPMLIAHHRFPTSTDNMLDQTHPLLVSHESLDHDYLVVHNGVIHNTDELKKKHEALGFKYLTEYEAYVSTYSKTTTVKFNDSESFSIEVARFLDGESDRIGTRGSAAFIAVRISKKTKKADRLFFGRNSGNPLNMAKRRGEMFLSSEGKGSPIEVDILYSCKLEGEMELTRKPILWAPEIVHTYQSKSSPTQGTSVGTASEALKPRDPYPGIPVEKPITGFVPKDTGSAGVVYSKSSSSGLLVPSKTEEQLTLTDLGITNKDDDAAYNRWWEQKQAAENGESLEDEGFLGSQREDIEFTLEEFFETLADPHTCGVMPIDDVVKTVRNALESAQKEATRIHALVEGDPTYADAH